MVIIKNFYTQYCVAEYIEEKKISKDDIISVFFNPKYNWYELWHYYN